MRIIFLFCRLTLSFSLACLASPLCLMGSPLFGRKVRRRLNPLFAQTLILDLLLVLDHPLFLFALERLHFVSRQGLMRQQIFVDQQRRPCIGRGITGLLGGEVTILPIGELLGLGDLFAETDGEDLLQAKIQDAVFGYHRLDIDTVGRREITPSTKAVDIIAKGETDLAYLRVGKDVRKGLRHAYMGETEEITTLMRGDLHEGSGIMGTPLKTRPCLGVDTDDRLLGQIGDGIGYLLFAIDDDDLPLEGRKGHELEQVLTDMCCLISHAMRALRPKFYVPNGSQTPRDKGRQHRA